MARPVRLVDPIQPDGSVSAGGTLTVTFGGSAPGSIGDDYGIVAGAPLLQGSITQVLLDATGDNTLDVHFTISGGALQTVNPALGHNFARSNYGVLRIAGLTLPSDFSGSFSLNGATIDLFGLPEPSSFVLAACLGLVSVLRRRKLWTENRRIVSNASPRLMSHTTSCDGNVSIEFLSQGPCSPRKV